MAHTLAASASADDVWIATSAGLYRGRDGACARVALPGRDVIAVAAVGGAVAAATDDLLWRSTDGGGTFRVVAGMVARPRALAIVDDQRTLVATDDAVIEIGLHGAVRAVLDQGGAALAVCDGLALAFTSDGAWTWRGDAAAERVGDRPPARMLACGGGQAARFIAAGDSLYASADGATWRERRAGAGRSVAAAAAIGNRIWLAADDGVVALDEIVTVHPGEAAGTRSPAAPCSPLPTRRLLEPVFPWPQLTLVFTAQHTPLRDGWSLVALVVFRLGRVAAARAEGGRLAAELVQRDAALAAHEIELATTPTEAAHTARRHCPRRAAARDTTRERGAAMIDPFCIGLLTLWLTQADALTPEPPAREPARRPAASVADGGAEPASPDRRPRDRRSDAALLRALAASDPPVDALRAAASALALTEPERARSLVLRARLAGWLPELRGGFYRRFARAESVDLGASRVDAARAGRN